METAVFLLIRHSNHNALNNSCGFDRQMLLSDDDLEGVIAEYGDNVVAAVKKVYGKKYNIVWCWDFQSLDGCRWVSSSVDFPELSFDIIAQQVYESMGFE